MTPPGAGPDASAASAPAEASATGGAPRAGSEAGAVPWWPLLLILLAGAVVRFVSLWLLATRLPFLDAPIGDAGAWLEAARDLRGAGSPTDPWFDPPGPALWLGLFLGLDRPGVGVAIAQVFLGSLLALLSALLAARLFGRREALFAALLVTLSSSLAFFEVQLLEGIPAALLALLGALFFSIGDGVGPAPETRRDRIEERRRIADGWRPRRPAGSTLAAMAASGAALGLLTLFQPGFLLAGPAVAVVLLVRALERRRHTALPAVFALAWLVALLPLAGHNLRHGTPIPWPTGAGVRLYLANRPDGGPLPAPRPPEFSGSRRALAAEADSFVVAATGRALASGPAFGWWTAAALRDVAVDLPRWLRLEGRKLALFLTRTDEEPGASMALEVTRVPHRRVLAVPPHFLLVLGGLGLLLAVGWAGQPRGSRGSLLVPGVLVMAALASALLEWPVARIRVVVLPLLAITAAHALVRADGLWRGGTRRPVVIGGALLGLGLVLGWSSPAGPWRRPAHEASLLVASAAVLDVRGDSLAADRWLAEAVDVDPGHVDARLARSRRALERRDLAAAVRELELAREAAPGDLTVRNNLGILYIQAQRFEEADLELRTAISLDPRPAGPWYYRGHVARAARDLESAIIYYREALKRDPRYGNAWARLVAALIEVGRLSEAREEADRATRAAVALPPEIRTRLGE
jgi:hypothetical protein